MSRRNPTQLARDRALAGKLYCEGWTQEEIAAEVTRRAKEANEGYSVIRSTIEYDLKQVRKQWVKEQAASIEERIATEIVKLLHVERIAWRAWRDSLKKKRSRAIKTGGQYGLEKTRKTEERDGNHRFLDVIYKCIDRRLSVLEPKYKPDELGGERTERVRKIFQQMRASVEGPPDGSEPKNVEITVIEPQEGGDNGKERPAS